MSALGPLRRALPWAPLLVLLVENLVLFARHYFAGAGFPWDFVGSYYAAPAFWTQAVQHGMFPHWMPYQWLGYPFFLNIQTSLFYPPLWLFPALHIPYTLHAAVVLQCLHVLAGSLGMYVFLRVVLRSRREALIGAFAYQLFGGFYSNAEHVDIVRAFAFAPWLLYTLTFRRSDPLVPRRLLAAPLAMFAFVTGAYPGATLGAFAIGGLYPLLETFFSWKPGERRRSTIRLLLAFALLALGIGMAATALGPPLLYRREFARTNLGPPSQAAFQLSHLAGLILTNTGLPGDISMTSTFVGFAVVFACFLIPWRALRTMGPVVGVAVFAGLMAAGPASPLYRLVRSAFSLFGSSRFPIADYRGWIAVGLVACAAASLRALRRRSLSVRRIVASLLPFFAFTAWAFRVAYGGGTSGSGRNIAVAVAALAVSTVAVLLWQARNGRPWRLAVPCLLAIVALDAARILVQMRGVWLVPDEIAVCRTFCKPLALMHDRNLVVAPEVLAGLHGPRPARIELGFDGYKASGYLLGTFNGRDNGKTKDLESKRAMDAVPWTRDYIRAPWKPLLYDPSLEAGGRVPDPDAIPDKRLAGSVAQTYYGLDRIDYEIQLPQPALFVENESYFPGWTARLLPDPTTPDASGRSATIAIAITAKAINGGLRGWALPAGRYRMEAQFRLPGFIPLAVLAGACWIVWLAAVALRRRFRHAGDRSPLRRPQAPLLAGAFLLLWFALSGLMLIREAHIVFRDAPDDMPPAEMLRQAAILDHLAPQNAPIFYVMPSLEAWNSRMWKRALYPRPVFYVTGPGEIGAAEYSSLRQKFGVRYALSVGSPPLDPGFAWKKELPPLPASTDVGWFGELR